ncbi:ASKHA domain-containing protein [Candidatus Electronema sp. JC]|uniref:ASKHA domain-containing protein n=1 Tax=Candidatus Electronema sp. JC TaxID=3401570 RepID=UPI003B43C8E4
MTAFPLTITLPLAAAPPSLADNTADLDRLKAACAAALPPELAGLPLRVPFARMAPLAAQFRAAGFKGWAIAHNLPGLLELFDFLPEEPKLLPGIALDLGSTHLEASLIDLRSGRTLARRTALNQQVEYGADILTRIHFAAKEEGLRQLQQAAVDSINSLIMQLCQEAAVLPEDIRAAVIAGNTTMAHLLLGLSPYHLCREPYIPLVNAPDPFPAAEIGLRLHPQAMTWLLPSRGSYFGGDLIAGILAVGLDQTEQPAMLIDVGTNAEVVIGGGDWLIACAGAAGPALEGGVARMGMRAAPGAIEQVSIDRESWRLTWRSIADAPPVGICGSGLIDLAAELYLARIIDLRGKFQVEFAEQSEAQRSFVCERLRQRGDELAFMIAEGVSVSQTDLDAMIRSKAAMYAILETLTAQVGLSFEELERIHVAGAFGEHISPRQAVTLGMLPDLPLERFQPAGNTSLAGAELLLRDSGCWARAQEVCRKITYLELNVNQDFMIRFSGSRFIPHTDPGLFPSVPDFSALGISEERRASRPASRPAFASIYPRALF